MALKNIVIMFLLILPIIVISGCTSSQYQINGDYTGQQSSTMFDNKACYSVCYFHTDGTVTVTHLGIINGLQSLITNTGKWAKNGDHYDIIFDFQFFLPDGSPYNYQEKIFFSYDPGKDAISFPDSHQEGYYSYPYSGTLYGNNSGKKINASYL